MKTQFFSPTSSFPAAKRADQCNEVIHLRSKEILKLEKQRDEIRLKCLGGIVWVTQPDDPNDHILQAHDVLEIKKKGLILVQALPEATICW